MLIPVEAWRESKVIGSRLREDHDGPNMSGKPIMRARLLPCSMLQSLDEIRILQAIIHSSALHGKGARIYLIR